MGKIDYLWHLQCIDSKEMLLRQELEDLGIKKTIQELESRLEKKHKALLDLTQRLKEKERAIKEKEGEVEENERKKQELEKRLYSGQSASSKELSQMQRKLAVLRKKGGELEERVIELMLEQEEFEGEKERIRGAIRELEGEYGREQVIYAQEAGKIEGELALLPAEREKILAKVEKNWLDLYRSLRERKKGQAVVAVRGDLCLGCRISLPTNIVSQIIANEQLQTCPNCGRILYYQGNC